jgi:hypothetical protein
MDQRTSMPPRSDAPGLKYGHKGQPYWIAKQVVRNTLDYPDRCIRLPRDADPDTLSHLCREATADLFAWIAKVHTEGDPQVTLYDGTVLSACRVYQEHPKSNFHKVKRNTRKSYTDSLKIIEATVGKRLIRNVTVLDVQYWYDQWRKPIEPQGKERIDRAHDAVCMFRTVSRFMAALRKPECKQLAEEMSLVKFERGGAREQEMTYEHAISFVRTALGLGCNGVIPEDRARSMAIGVATQFETLLRQKDVIGEWGPTTAQRKIPVGQATVTAGDQIWAGYFTWENIPGWRWRIKTSKSKYRAPAVFDLSIYPMLFPLLDSVPFEQRQGAIVKGDSGLPIRERSYRKWFRQIARAAGIPDDVWSMDSRAGGATEAEEAGAGLEAVQDNMTHSKQRDDAPLPATT